MLEDPEKSYHAKFRVKEGHPQIHADERRLPKQENEICENLRSSADEIGDLFDNRLIFGDNLLALKALESQRNEKRRSLFEAQDKVDQQREELIASIKGKLTQYTDLKTLFTLRWRLA